MTTIGKALVFALLVMSLMFAAWSFAVYSQRIDWVKASGPDKSRVLLDKVKKEVDDFANSRNIALGRWVTANNELTRFERDRKPRADWYVAQLEALRTGAINGNPVNAPVMTLPTQVDANGLFPIPADKAPREAVKHNNIDLLSLAGYAKTIADTEREIAAAMKATQDAVANQKAYTLQLDGDPTSMDWKTFRGLRALLTEQRDAFRATVEEQDYLLRPAAMQFDDRRRLQRRLDQLQAREKELTAAPARTADRR